MMNEFSFRSRVLELVIEHLEDDSVMVTEDTLLNDSLGFDSLTMVMIANAIEDEFSIDIDLDMLQGLESVKDIIDKLLQAHPGLIAS